MWFSFLPLHVGNDRNLSEIARNYVINDQTQTITLTGCNMKGEPGVGCETTHHMEGSQHLEALDLMIKMIKGFGIREHLDKKTIEFPPWNMGTLCKLSLKPWMIIGWSLDVAEQLQAATPIACLYTWRRAIWEVVGLLKGQGHSEVPPSSIGDVIQHQLN